MKEKREYLLINVTGHVSSLTTTIGSIPEDYRQVHLNFTRDFSHDYISQVMQQVQEKWHNAQLYMYAHAIGQVVVAKQHRWHVHYCLLNDAIAPSNAVLEAVHDDPQAEVFWLMDNRLLHVPLEQQLGWLASLNRAVCPVITGVLRHELQDNDHEALRQHVAGLHQCFNNPLYEMELNMPVGSWMLNDYVQISAEPVVRAQLVMGVVGDIFLQGSSMEHVNKRQLLKNPACQSCELYGKCETRGIGHVMKALQLNGCAGYLLLEPSRTDL